MTTTEHERKTDDQEKRPSHHTSPSSQKRGWIIGASAAAALVVVIAFALGFALGQNSQPSYQKNNSKNDTKRFDNGSHKIPGGYMPMMGMQHGTVKTNTASSITITARSGDEQTYTINSDTLIKKAGKTIKSSDITKGDTVMIHTGRTDDTSTVATTIIVY